MNAFFINILSSTLWRVYTVYHTALHIFYSAGEWFDIVTWCNTVWKVPYPMIAWGVCSTGDVQAEVKSIDMTNQFSTAINKMPSNMIQRRKFQTLYHDNVMKVKCITVTSHDLHSVSNRSVQPFAQAYIKETSKPRATGPFYRLPVDSPHNGPITRDVFSFKDVIMAIRIAGPLWGNPLFIGPYIWRAPQLTFHSFVDGKQSTSVLILLHILRWKFITVTP